MLHRMVQAWADGDGCRVIGSQDDLLAGARQ
jgi:hypothetical protein